jgi:capsular exopolysaccharide synthesis family protein
MSGLGLGYLVELADRRFRTPEDVRHHLGLPLIGHIPVIHETGSRKRQSGATPSDGHIAPVLCAARRPKSCEAEAVRAVRTALYFSSRGQRHKVIQITSPDAGDGKTTLASNLAISIASSGKKTLLVDGDLRRATVHKMFGLENSVGLVELIGSGAKLADGVRQGPVENLWIISSGRQHGNPSELLTSPRFHELLDVLRQKYDFIIIDTPPMLPVTDPSVVAARVDGVLLVIRLTKHARDHASRAVEMLGALGATVLGVVVNGIGRAGGYGYRREYHYGYGYAYGYAHGNGKDGYYSETPEEPEPTVAETKA